MSMAQWQNFAVLIGGASATLTGLLFVAVSLHLARIAASARLRAAAVQTLLVLVSPLFLTVLLTIPGQRPRLLGLEVLSGALLLGGSFLFRVVRRARAASASERRAARLYQIVAPTLVTTLLLLVSGFSLVVGHGGGLDCLVPAMLVALGGGVADAWLLMMRLAHEPPSAMEAGPTDRP